MYTEVPCTTDLKYNPNNLLSVLKEFPVLWGTLKANKKFLSMSQVE
jgi:hypothetical protein